MSIFVRRVGVCPTLSYLVRYTSCMNTEKAPDLRERPVDYGLIKNSDGQWILTSMAGQEIPVNDTQLATEINTLLVTQLYSDSISKEGVPGKDAPTFYDSPVTVATWPHNFDDTKREHQSVKQVADDFCHRTANRLLPEAARREFDVPFTEVLSLEDVNHVIQSVSLPAIVQFGWETGGEYRRKENIHSCIALVEAEGKIVCFQKFGYGLPYELVSLDKVYDYWSAVARHEDKDLLIKAIAK